MVFPHNRFVGSAIILTTTRRGGVPSSAMIVPPESCEGFFCPGIDTFPVVGIIGYWLAVRQLGATYTPGTGIP